ncbi:MAG: hypothetical protein AAF495_11110 [Pseudomonadota bacterium]
MSLAREVLLGPFAFLSVSKLGAALMFVIILAFTATTQIGGVLLWVMLPALRRLHRVLRPSGAWLAWPASVIGFALAYLAVTLFVVPPLASQFGRVALPCYAEQARPYGAASAIFCLANRHYAVPEVHGLLDGLSRHLADHFPGSEVSYLDASFPFFDGFPLPPHLSHHDGRKIDLAFFYESKADGRSRPKGAAWPIGYWAFTGPEPDEAQPCADFHDWRSLRWDFDWLQPRFADSVLDQERTRAMLAWLVGEGASLGVEKVLLEPHLRNRLGATSALIRFQGCRAARHDDHIHVQLRKPAPRG